MILHPPQSAVLVSRSPQYGTPVGVRGGQQKSSRMPLQPRLSGPHVHEDAEHPSPRFSNMQFTVHSPQ